MLIEFELSRDYNQRDQQMAELRTELMKWCYKHGYDYWLVTTHYNSDRNVEQVTIPSPRALELFCLSWAPTVSSLESFVLRKG